MKLVIVESPAKAKTIQKYLGKGYQVIASKGHIADLPKSELGVDVDKDYKPKYVVTNTNALKALKDKLKDATEVVLAVDQDREGEAIAWHVANRLNLLTEKGRIKDKNRKISRIVFTEITKSAIENAVNNPREINMNLVDAQQARRVLDRLVGYKLSPLLWKKIRFGLSAGRVQSVALRLIVDREKERDAFVPEEFWDIFIIASTKKSEKKLLTKIIKADEKDELILEKDQIKFQLVKDPQEKNVKIVSESAVKEIVSKLHLEDLKIDTKESKEIKRTPYPPFTTSTLQQAAANRMGWSARETMRVAQKLYENGYITYMRTDSTNLSAQAIAQARKVALEKYGEGYVPEQEARVYSSKSKLAQEAHEAIRPTDFKKEAKDLKLDEKGAKLYRLIWERAISSQMVDAKLSRDKLTLKVNDYLFQANGQRILFPGFLKAYSLNIAENLLPEIEVGQNVYAQELNSKQRFTQPPARFSEASLIKTLESFGIGRPSTYAPTISTILTRRYVEKENKYLIPTDVGKVVIALLVENFPEIVDVGFTAKVEDDLDSIAEGQKEWIKMIDEFYKPFQKHIEEREENIKRSDYTVLGKSEEKCPECGKKMVIKLGKYGRFLSCSNFPECKGMKSLEENEISTEEFLKSDTFKDNYKAPPKTDDGRDYELKRGRYGRFWAHPDYPKVKDAKPMELSDEAFKKIYGVVPKSEDGKKMVLRRGRFGEFWAHPDYPEKKEIKRIKTKEVVEKKKELGILE